MFSLFDPTQAPRLNRGIGVPPSWPHFSRQLKHQLNRHLQYYRTQSRGADNTSVFLRILHGFNVPVSVGIKNYRLAIESIATRIAGFQGATTLYEPGTELTGCLFGKDAPVYLLISDVLDDNAISDEELVKNWQTLQPLRAVAHSQDDLDMNPIDQRNTKNNDIVVMNLNVTYFFVQWWAYVRYCRANQIQGSANLFLTQWVFPNALQSVLEIAIFNRLKRRFYEALSSNTKAMKVLSSPRTILMGADLTPYLDDVIDKMLVNIYRSDGRFQTVLQRILGFTGQCAGEFLKTPKVVGNANTNWLCMAARLSDVIFLIDICDKKTTGVNTEEYATIGYDLRTMNTVSLLKNNVSAKVAPTMVELINTLRYKIDYRGHKE